MKPNVNQTSIEKTTLQYKHTHTYTNHTIQKCLIAFSKMLPLNKESNLQMKINFPFYISHNKIIMLYRPDWWNPEQKMIETFWQSAYWKLIIKP